MRDASRRGRSARTDGVEIYHRRKICKHDLGREVRDFALGDQSKSALLRTREIDPENTVNREEEIDDRPCAIWIQIRLHLTYGGREIVELARQDET